MASDRKTKDPMRRKPPSGALALALDLISVTGKNVGRYLAEQAAFVRKNETYGTSSTVFNQAIMLIDQKETVGTGHLEILVEGIHQ